ncbi:hypothetical protein [Wolbachia endosymbiont of Atemnus politus]|uniref:hypothetical protein n=1 Tax=Wolbachia endosymbiont of Atemnus politus TaxID=2682840 RepID=UPI001FE53097|nr:hypothetical protein [Wolbachia endosymbiont of Atemnus politus]
MTLFDFIERKLLANELGQNNKNNRIIVNLFINRDPSIMHWDDVRGVTNLFIIVHD